jgi:hypothetical protein
MGSFGRECAVIYLFFFGAARVWTVVCAVQARNCFLLKSSFSIVHVTTVYLSKVFPDFHFGRPRQVSHRTWTVRRTCISIESPSTHIHDFVRNLQGMNEKCGRKTNPAACCCTQVAGWLRGTRTPKRRRDGCVTAGMGGLHGTQRGRCAMPPARFSEAWRSSSAAAQAARSLSVVRRGRHGGRPPDQYEPNQCHSHRHPVCVAMGIRAHASHF